MQGNNTTKGFDADFDTFWKEVLDLVEPATAFFLPDLHGEVDWSVKYKSLEQELRGPFAAKKGRIKRTDKLFRLRLKDGSNRFVLFHIEAEVSPNSHFPRRIFEYYTYLLVKYQFEPVTVLGLFVGDDPAQKFDQYRLVNYGTGIDFYFSTFCIAQQTEADLLSSENPIALAVLANIYVIQSKGDSKKRFDFKRKLINILAERSMPLQKFREILNFALYFVKLPQKEEHHINELLFQKTIVKNTVMTNKLKAKIPDYMGMIERAMYLHHKDEMIEQIYGKLGKKAKAAAEKRIVDDIEKRMEDDIKKKIEGDIKKKIEGDIKKKIEGDIKKKIEGDIKKKIEGDIQQWKKTAEQEVTAIKEDAQRAADAAQKEAMAAKEAAQKELDEKLHAFVNNLFYQLRLSPEQIASAVELDVTRVNQILGK